MLSLNNLSLALTKLIMKPFEVGIHKTQAIYTPALLKVILEKIWNLGISFLGKFAFRGNYLGNISFRWIFLSLSYKNFLKFVKHSYFWDNFWPRSRKSLHFVQPSYIVPCIKLQIYPKILHVRSLQNMCKMYYQFK